MKTSSLLPSLRPLVEMPFEDKYAITQVVIQHNLRELGKDCAVAFSGGKDSLVVLWLVTRLYPHIPVVFNNTGVEYPETVQFVHETADAWNLNLIETRPERTFWDCADEYGFPHTKSNRAGHKSGARCCYWLKEKPMNLIMKALGAKGYFTGVTAVENRNRMIRAITHGTCYMAKDTGLVKVHPILYWTPDEVWSYLKENRIDTNPMYFHPSHLVDRVGCSVCTAFLGWEKQLSAVNPKLYQLVKTRMAERA